MDKNDLKQIMKERRAILPRKLFRHPEKYIPKGIYCCHMPDEEFYDKFFSEKWLETPIFEITSQKDFYRDFYSNHGMPFEPCPFWFDVESRLAYCCYLQISDFDPGVTALWDQVKECDVNYETPKSDK